MTITYLGIFTSTGKPHFTYAALDDDRRVLALGQGGLADVLAYAAGLAEARIGISAPTHLSDGRMAQPDVRSRFHPKPPGRLFRLRVADYELVCRGVNTPAVPAARGDCSRWLLNGLELVEQLAGMGYEPHPGEDSARQWLETPAEGVFAALLGLPSFAGGTLESRLQRQLCLRRGGVVLPDPMDFFEEVSAHRLLNGILPMEKIHSAAELDALAAAFTAWLSVHNPSGLMTLGDEDEALIWLPKSEFFQNPPKAPDRQLHLFGEK